MKGPVLTSVSPSGDTIKVFVEGDRVSLFMLSVDGMRARGCDNRPQWLIDEVLRSEEDIPHQPHDDLCQRKVE